MGPRTVLTSQKAVEEIVNLDDPLFGMLTKGRSKFDVTGRTSGTGPQHCFGSIGSKADFDNGFEFFRLEKVEDIVNCVSCNIKVADRNSDLDFVVLKKQFSGEALVSLKDQRLPFVQHCKPVIVIGRGWLSGEGGLAL